MIKNIFWKFLERIFVQLLNFITSIILARFLEPEFYGFVAFALVFITIAEIFVSEGIPIALIQKKEVEQIDFSTALTANIVLSVLIYALLFCLAPLIFHIFPSEYDHAILIFRVFSLRIIFIGIHSIQLSFISKNMMFRELLLATVLSTFFSSLISIVLVLRYIGIWVLVIQNLSSLIILTIILLFIIRKEPGFSFSKERFFELGKNGSNLTATAFLIQGFEQFQSLAIKAVFSSSDLAYYDKGKHFPYMLVNNINSPISSVFFPYISSIQNKKDEVKRYTKQTLRYSSFLICPMMLGFASVAKSFVTIFLTDKWLPIVPFLQAFCIVYLFYPLHSANNQSTKAIGRNDICLKNEIIKKVFGLIVFLITININITFVAYGLIIRTIIGSLIDMAPNSSLFDYSMKEQMLDFLPSLSAGLAMSALVYSVSVLPIRPLPNFFLQVFVGIFSYIIISFFTNNKDFNAILSVIKTSFTSKKTKV